MSMMHDELVLMAEPNPLLSLVFSFTIDRRVLQDFYGT